MTGPGAVHAHAAGGANAGQQRYLDASPLACMVAGPRTRAARLSYDVDGQPAVTSMTASRVAGIPGCRLRLPREVYVWSAGSTKCRLLDEARGHLVHSATRERARTRSRHGPPQGRHHPLRHDREARAVPEQLRSLTAAVPAKSTVSSTSLGGA